MQTSFLKTRTVLNLIVCALLLLSACRKTDHAAEENTQQERLAFKDLKQLYETVDQIEKMNESQVIQWEKVKGHQSFRDYIYSLDIDAVLTKSDESLLQLPVSYQVLLNRKGEIRIGDTIVWYNQGNKYYVHANNIARLKEIQANPALGEVRDHYSFTDIDAPRVETDYPLSFLDARYQREFYAQAPSAGCRKYVHELRGILDGWYGFNDPFCGPGITFYARLLLSIKLEWKTCSRSKWNPAGEQRTVSYNLNRNIRLRGVYPPCGVGEANILFNTPVNASPFNTTSNVDVALGGYGGNSASQNIYWEVTLSGSIYHHINGDVTANEWNHVGSPFF